MFKYYNILFKWITLKQKKQLIIFLIFSIIIAIIESAGFFSLIPFIGIITDPSLIDSNYYLNNIYNYFLFKNYKEFQIYFGFYILFFIVIINSFFILQVYLSSKLSEEIGHHISRQLFKNFILQNYNFHLKNTSAELASIITLETPRIRTNIILASIELLAKSFSLIILFSFLLFFYPLIALLAILISVGIYIFVFYFFKNTLNTIGRQISIYYEGRQKTLQESLRLIKEIKLYNLENYISHFFDKFSISLQKIFIKNQYISRIPKFLIEMILFSFFTLMLIYLIYISRDINQIIFFFTTLIIFIYRVLPYSQSIYNSLSAVASNINSLVKIDFSFENNNEANQKYISNIFEKSDVLSFRNLNFYFDNSQKILKNINFKIKKNSINVIMGESGAGKTTLINCISGLLKNNSGEVIINQNLESLNVLKNSIAFVNQEVLLIDDTIENNITLSFGKEIIDHEKLDNCIKLSNLSNFVDTKREKLNFNVGEFGARVSIGQKQRIGIARALYRDCEIIIMDEPTSSLDQEAVKLINDSIVNLSKYKTLIITSHQKEIIGIANQIIELRNGEISYCGSPLDYKR